MPNLLSKHISAEVFTDLVDLGEKLSQKIDVNRKQLDELAMAAFGVSEF